MWTALQRHGRAIRQGLTSLDSRPVGKTVLAMVLFLDLFILLSIFEGLDDHTRQLTAPAKYIPQQCRDMVIDRDWNRENRLLRIARMVSVYSGSYLYVDDRPDQHNEHPICQPLSRLEREIRYDKALAGRLSEYLRLRNESAQLQREHRRVKGAYDTTLLTEIARDNDAGGETVSLEQRINETTRKIESLVQRETAMADALLKQEKIAALFAAIEGVADSDRERLLSDLRSLNFWHPVKRLGMEMLFLAPLVAAFYFWNAVSIRKARPFQTLVSSHLLVVVFIPVLFKIVELVYEIIPKKLLEQVIELLESLNLVAIWHYLLMAAGILASLGLIYLFQKRLFSRERLVARRISKGQCQECGAGLPAGSSACPMCGFSQYRPCPACKRPTHVYGRYCRECGAMQEDNSQE